MSSRRTGYAVIKNGLVDCWIAGWLGEFKKSLRNRDGFRINRIFEVLFYGTPSLNICYSACSMRNWTWSVFFGEAPSVQVVLEKMSYRDFFWSASTMLAGLSFWRRPGFVFLPFPSPRTSSVSFRCSPIFPSDDAYRCDRALKHRPQHPEFLKPRTPSRLQYSYWHLRHLSTSFFTVLKGFLYYK